MEAAEPTGWPPLQHERLEWTPHPATGWPLNPPGPRVYDAALPPLIASLPVLLPSVTMQRAEAASAELIRFDTQLGERVAAFEPVLLRSEAAASSQIEHLTASARRILTAEITRSGSSNAVLIAANTRAMQAAIALAGDLSADSIRAMHQVLLEAEPRHTPGQWRTEQVWIGTSASSPVGADFVAPSYGRVPELIDDLVAFSTRDDIPPLVQVALAHAQFETIHPFIDGNGLTGRAFAQSMLRAKGITRNVAIPVSAGLLAGVDSYYASLTAYRAGNPLPIIEAFADAASAAVENAARLVGDIDTIRASWNARVTARRDSGVWPLLDAVARRPVLNATIAAEELGVHPTNVYRLLNALTEAGILRSKKEHLDGPFWRSDEMLGAIDAFAERAGRRRAVL